MIDGYSFCLNKWLFDKEIKDELSLLIAISSLSAQYGFCFATNDYLATQFNTSTTNISRKLKKLEDKGYLKIEYKRNGNAIVERKIYITELLAVIKNDNGPLSKMITAVIKNDKDNIIKTNIINNNREIYIEEIEKWKPILTPNDFEIINKIVENFTIEQVKEAIPICEYNNARSLKYLIQVLTNPRKEKINGVIQNKKVAPVPSWINQEIESKQISDEDLKRLKKEFEEFL